MPNVRQIARQKSAESPPSEDAARNVIEKRASINVSGIPKGVLRVGMDYADMRRVILAAGWIPMIDKQCKVNVDEGDKLCQQMPELSGCSVDGYCVMHFRLPNTNQSMEVGTFGDTTGWDIGAKDSQLAVTGLTISTTKNH
jgi:hypothetical protein